MIILVKFLTPTTLGIPSADANIPTCEVFPPTSIASPNTKSRGIDRVSDGLKALVTRMTGS